MRGLFRFNWIYFNLTVVLLGIEIVIARYVHDQIVRPYVGDILVVVLIYCFIKSFLDTPVFITALSVLIFSFAIETLQYFQIVTRLGLQDSTIAKTVIGTSFEWVDLLAYTIGFVLIIYFEKKIQTKISTEVIKPNNAFH